MYSINYCSDENTKLPVPCDILSMFGGNDKPCALDDPDVHEGRIRSFPHERGNWASLVYIPRMFLNLLFYLSQAAAAQALKKWDSGRALTACRGIGRGLAPSHF